MNLHVVFDRHMPMQATKSKQSLMIETLVFDIRWFSSSIHLSKTQGYTLKLLITKSAINLDMTCNDVQNLIKQIYVVIF